ncbi:MAG: hypothetical protein ABJG68_13405 [Crocinitomicaceae bacterium]
MSKTFIRGQRLSLPFVRGTDRKALYWISKGVPIVECDMVDMAELPKFQNSLDFAPEDISEFKVLDVKNVRKRLKQSFSLDGFIGVAIQSELEIKALEKNPTFHAMARHMLESLIRTCNMAPIYNQMAKERSLPSTLELSTKMFKHHLHALTGCRRIDKLAAPLQAKGIPIIHQDVPYISPFAPGFEPFNALPHKMTP